MPRCLVMVDILSFVRAGRREGSGGPGPRHHCIISGTGRAGTSFLVQLLTYLGFDTGFTEDTLVVDQNARAGLESNILSPNAPYIVKNPWLCDTIKDVLRHREIVIDHAFIPYRELEAASKSRAYVQQLAGGALVGRSVPGGLWHTDEPSSQQGILAEQFYKLVTALGEAGVPMTFMSYPRLAKDAKYTYEKMDTLMRRIPYSRFQEVFHKVSCPDLIHQFTANDC